VVVTTGAYYGQRINLYDYDDEHLLQRLALLALNFAATTPYNNVDNGGINDDDDGDAWATIGTISPTASATNSPTNSDTDGATDSATDGATDDGTSGSTSISNNVWKLLLVQDDLKFLIDECDWEGMVCSRVFTPLPGGGTSTTTNNNTTTMTTTNDANTTTNNASKFLVTKIRWDYLDLPGTISSSLRRVDPRFLLFINRIDGTVFI